MIRVTIMNKQIAGNKIKNRKYTIKACQIIIFFNDRYFFHFIYCFSLPILIIGMFMYLRGFFELNSNIPGKILLLFLQEHIICCVQIFDNVRYKSLQVFICLLSIFFSIYLYSSWCTFIASWCCSIENFHFFSLLNI